MKKKVVFGILVAVFLAMACITVGATDGATDGAYKHVAIIGVDGAGTYFRDADTPCIDSIFENGAVSYDVLTSDPTVSAQSWTALLHGVTPWYHGVTNPIAGSKRFSVLSLYPSVFRVIREQDADAVLASFVHWSAINFGIVEEGIGVHKVSGLGDAALTESICSYVAENRPKLLFVQFDDADHVGHSVGFGSADQLAKITELDGYIGEIYDAYETAGILGDTLFIVTADHGGNGLNHGGWTDGERYVMFAAAGKTVEKGTIGDMAIRDTAAITLHALGYKAPATWTARVPGGLFAGVAAAERKYYSPAGSPRAWGSVPTPEKGGAYYVTSFTDKLPAVYLPFDGNVDDAMGNATAEKGSISYSQGYFGKGIVLDNGYVSLGDYALGTEDFSVAFWIRTEGLTGSDPCLLSNKVWSSGRNAGFCFAFDHAKQLKFNAGDGSNRTDAVLALPEDFYEGWMHVVLSVDRDAGKVGICCDFGELVETNIASALLKTTFDSGLPLHIGQDGLAARTAIPAVLDEFMLFDCALTDADVQALRAYYTLPAEDVDGDRAVTVKDVLHSLQSLLLGEYPMRGDVDGNGELSLLDVIRILKATVIA